MLGIGIGINRNPRVLPKKPFGQLMWQSIVKQWQTITDKWNS